MRAPVEYATQLCTDAMDVFTAVQCARPHAGQGQSIGLYVESLKEDLREGRVTELAWVGNGDNLADSLTKDQKDMVFLSLMSSGSWRVQHWEFFTREDEYYEEDDSRCAWLGCPCLHIGEPQYWWCLPVTEEDPQIFQLVDKRSPYGLSDSPKTWFIAVENAL